MHQHLSLLLNNEHNANKHWIREREGTTRRRGEKKKVEIARRAKSEWSGERSGFIPWPIRQVDPARSSLALSVVCP